MSSSPHYREAIRLASDPPEITATTGITYYNFSKALDILVSPNPGANVDKHIMDLLYSAVRLREWTGAFGDGFQIYNMNRSRRVLVTQKSVEIYGPSDWYLKVGTGKTDATVLFNSIQHAQELIRTSLNTTDNVNDEEFFEPPSEQEKSEAIDLMLKDQGHTLNGNKLASQEAQEIKDEYPEKSDPKQYASMDEARAHKHIKSLQGRVLTIVDATLADKQQREAVKQLVNKEFRREMKKISEYFADPNAGESME